MTDYLYRYAATIVDWVDGDTLDMKVDLGFHVTYSMRARLFGIDAPETSLRAGVTPEEKKAGRDLTAMLQKRYPTGYRVEIDSHKAEKYGRWLAVVWVTDENSGELVNLNQWLVDEGLAKEY